MRKKFCCAHAKKKGLVIGVPARLSLDNAQAELKLDFSQIEEIGDIDTLGGLVFALAGRVPERGEIIDCHLGDGQNVEFIIRDGDARRIKSLDIRIISG